jgi:Tfp pilus assembly protein PilN
MHDTPEAPAPAPARVDWATVPRVNLLPPEVIASLAFRRTQKVLAAAVVAALALIAGAFWWAQAGVSSAQALLEQEQTVTTRLQREQAKYADVPKLIATVQAAESARQSAMANDVEWYSYLYDVSRVTPSRVWLTSLTATVPMPGAASTATTTTDPLTVTGAGTLVVTGKAPAFSDVAAWLDAVNTVDGLTASVLDTAVLDGDLDTPRAESFVTFTSRITVTDAAYTHRFDRKAS